MPQVMRALTSRDWSALSRRELFTWGSLGLAGTGLVWMSDWLSDTDRARFDQQVSRVFRWLIDKLYGDTYRRRRMIAFGHRGSPRARTCGTSAKPGPTKLRHRRRSRMTEGARGDRPSVPLLIARTTMAKSATKAKESAYPRGPWTFGEMIRMPR